MTMTKSDPYRVVRWPGGKCDHIDQVCFEVLEDRLSASATIYQLGYSTFVDASSLTHAGGAAYDYRFPTVDERRQVRESRDLGIVAWKRNPPFPLHDHCIRHGSRTAHPEAKQQRLNYVDGGDGLWPLIPSDDRRPYRPSPIATFTIDDYHNELRRRARADRLRDKLRRIGRNLKHLLRKKRKVRRQLKKHHHH